MTARTLIPGLKPLMLLFALLMFALPLHAEDKLKALIVDGQNNHNWVGTSPVLKELLEQTGLFEVEVATTPTQDDKKADEKKYREDLAKFAPAFHDYDVVVMNYNGDSWSPATMEAFDKYVRDGGGLVIYHAANNSFSQWDAYNKMCAVGGWGGRNEKSGPYLYWEDGKVVRNPEKGHGGSHGPQWEFLLEIREPEHPITKGLPLKIRHCKDELYDRLRGPAENVTILATAFADSEKGGTGRHEPMLMVIKYGNGRVFHICTGHDVQQCREACFYVPFQRGTQWAATGKVTLPVPENLKAE